VNAPGKEAYPISSFTWVILYANPSNPAKAKKLVDFLRWALHDGETVAPSLDYAPLPASMVKMLDKRLGEIKVASR
jgi:phosphate transport system substrate-binding protein